MNKEQKVLEAREEAARMSERRADDQRALERRDGRETQRGESSRAAGKRIKAGKDNDPSASAGDVTNLHAELHDENPEFMMSGGASGPPLSDSAAALPDHVSTDDVEQERKHARSRSAREKSSSHSKQKFDRHGKPLVRGERGWRDASPAPFPEYKFKKGPMFGFGDLLKERFRWGIENYHLEQRRKERRWRGSLDERRSLIKGKEVEKAEGLEAEKREPMSNSEGKRPYKRGHSPHSRIDGLSGGARDSDRRNDRRRVDKSMAREHSQPDGRGKHRRRSEERDAHDRRKQKLRKANAEADALSRGERRARHEAKVEHACSRHRPTRGLEGEVSVYEQSPHSQQVEARERAEAEHFQGK